MDDNDEGVIVSSSTAPRTKEWFATSEYRLRSRGGVIVGLQRNFIAGDGSTDWRDVPVQELTS